MGEKKKILIFAHYYAPDTASTGQILKDQAEGMLDEFDVTVICVVPSYSGRIEEKYKTQKYSLFSTHLSYKTKSIFAFDSPK